MQRLYCINNKPIPDAANSPEALGKLKEGEIYVGEQRKVKGSLVIAWCIPSISTTDGYHIDRFIPLPDNTADEMAEESHEAIVNLETA